MKKIVLAGFFLLLCTALVCAPIVEASIHEAKTMSEVCTLFNECSADDFAIFDIDYTLTQPSDPYFHASTFSKHKTIVKSVVNSLDPSQVDAFYSLVIASSPGELIDTKALTLLNSLKEREIRTIAFTGLVTGSLDATSSLEAWRIEDLRKLGINFTTLFQDSCEIVFNEIPSYRNNHPTFKGGVLFSNGIFAASKGEVLLAFLKRIDLHPKRIFFVDDSMDNLESANAVIEKQFPDIAFVGIHYVGAKNASDSAVEACSFETKYQLFANRIKQLK